MKRIALTRGLFATVDDCDLAFLSRFKWHAVKGHKTWYAATKIAGVKVRMHWLVLGSKGQKGRRLIDHRDGNGLNCRRENLRFATHAQNIQNQAPRSKTGFKGVYRSGSRFLACLTYKRKKRGLGIFDDPRDAARAYDAAALKLHGPSAATNFGIEVRA